MEQITPPTPPKSCMACQYVDTFNPRPDECERGLTLGCRKPGYEGYTHHDRMACGGVFFVAKLQEEQR